jgi:signal transduction histidine kinase
MLGAAAAAMLSDPHPYSPAAWHLLRSLARENNLADLSAPIDKACRDAESAERFQADYAQAGGADPARWLSWGAPLFLIGFAPATDGSFWFRAVSAGGLATKVARDSGYPLGDPFPGLRAPLDPVPPPQEGLGRRALGGMLGAALLLAILGGLLLWRDYHRDRQLAALRTQFIAGVSHDLRTPLTAIRMFIESLRMNPELDVTTRNDYLDTMQRESERLSRLVNNVLEFSRIERHTIQLVRDEENVRTAADECRRQRCTHAQPRLGYGRLRRAAGLVTRRRADSRLPLCLGRIDLVAPCERGFGRKTRNCAAG